MNQRGRRELVALGGGGLRDALMKKMKNNEFISSRVESVHGPKSDQPEVSLSSSSSQSVLFGAESEEQRDQEGRCRERG